MIDGGVWANNPVMNALVDALACYEIERHQVRILSLGCGEKTFTVGDARARGGMAQWVEGVRCGGEGPVPERAGQAFLLVGKQNVLRLDSAASANPIALDNYTAAKERLPEEARSLVEAGGREVQRVFLTDRWIRSSLSWRKTKV